MPKHGISLKVSALSYTSGWLSSLHYRNINTNWVNRYDSRRFSLSFMYKLAGGKIHRDRISSSADEQGRAEH